MLPGRVRVAWVLVAALLPGCSLLEACPAYDTVAWRDRALYDAIGPDPVEDIAPYAVGSASVVGAPEGILHTVRWAERDDPRGASVELRADTISVIAWSAEDARDALTRFLGAHSLAGEDADARTVAWAMNDTRVVFPAGGDAANGTDVLAYTSSNVGPWSFERAFANASRRQDHDGLGRAAFVDGAYWADVWFPVRGTSVEGFPLRVDAEGKAELGIGDRDGRSPASSLERARAAMAVAGHAPLPEEARVYSDPC